MLQIFATFNVWRNEAELIAFVFGVLPAHFARIIVAIHVDVAAFFAAEFADLFVALLKIRTAAVSAPLGMADVGAVYRVGNECTVTRVLVDAAATRVRLPAKIANMYERVAIRPDTAAVVHPTAHPDTPSASCFRRQGSPTDARARFVTAATPGNP